jgi:phage terminase large subunit-like protein
MTPPRKIRYKRLSRSEARALDEPYYFDQAAADHACNFFSLFLRHSRGRWAGKPFELLDWQRNDIIREVFGWKRTVDDLRRFRTAYIEVPKKNGKSTLLAGIGLYLLVADGESGAEVYGAACDREQASIIYREAAAMVRASPELSRVLEVVDSRKTIAMPAKASFYRVLSADGFRAEGLNIHGLLFDELHAQKDRRLWDALRYGGAAREQPLLVSITTAGYDRNSICYEQHRYAKQVMADESIDPTFFGFVAGASEDDDWTSEPVWRKANPSLGETMKVDDFAADCAEAQLSNTKENAFKRYRLNIWTHQDTRWLKMAAWEGGGAKPPRPLEGRPCWCGLDLATTFDTSAFVAIFPDDDGTVDVVSRFWIPAENATERERRDRVPYLVWARDPASGLTLTDGNVTDYDVIRRDILAFAAKYNIRKIGVDRWNATQLSTQLQGDGIEVVGFSQGFSSMSGPSKTLENMIVGGRLRHAQNPVLSWMANNVSVKSDANGNIRPVKPKSNSPDRIDGIVSLVMAIGVYTESQKEPPKPVPEIVVL